MSECFECIITTRRWYIRLCPSIFGLRYCRAACDCFVARSLNVSMIPPWVGTAVCYLTVDAVSSMITNLFSIMFEFSYFYLPDGTSQLNDAIVSFISKAKNIRAIKMKPTTTTVPMENRIRKIDWKIDSKKRDMSDGNYGLLLCFHFVFSLANTSHALD